MAYRVNFYDATTTKSGLNYFSVNDATINTDTFLSFVGKNWYGYGETIAENQLHLLENFAADAVPGNTKAVAGQLHYNKTDNTFYKFNGTIWEKLGGAGVKFVSVNDTSNVAHIVQISYDNDQTTPISIQSLDTEFNVHASETAIQPTFPKIGKGITLSNLTDMFFHGTAVKALYADLAEMYLSDAEYEVGTVLKIGGEAEVTQTTNLFDPEVFGVVSSDPAYLMNSGLEGNAVAVALEGRVQVKVIGQVKKGERLLASEEPGVARAPTDYERQEHMDWYRIVGRALEDKTTESIGLVEVVVGAK
jgi:hypothetical protein